MSHRASALALAVLASAALAAPVAAHTGHEVGDYILEIGWLDEPAFVGQPNAVQVTISHHDDGAAVIDLAAGALSVVVTTAGVDSPALALEPAFDAAEKTGPLGEYDAALVPTAPGDYSFHITGTIHATAVDLTVTSGEDTFDPVVASTELEFPAKMPTLTEVGTRLDRIDSRIAALQSAAPAPSGDGDGALQAAREAADVARAAVAQADKAFTTGLLIGGAGLIVALVALFVAFRATRRGSSAA